MKTQSSIKEKYINGFDKHNLISLYNIGLEKGEKYDHDLDKYLSSLYYSDDRYPEIGDVSELFFLSGFMGFPVPEVYIGWRYGKIPESGKSHNFKDNFQEKGLSMMEIYDHDNNKSFDKISTSFINNREIVECIGFLHFELGSDNEFLLVGAMEI